MAKRNGIAWRRGYEAEPTPFKRFAAFIYGAADQASGQNRAGPGILRHSVLSKEYADGRAAVGSYVTINDPDAAYHMAEKVWNGVYPWDCKTRRLTPTDQGDTSHGR